ncbi:hypothetical protein HDU93_008087 [Gonapodya sp. JEL0774]|nr:hypothetical protein HDU93_008087 [Gonapodya sp. JEL0774]
MRIYTKDGKEFLEVIRQGLSGQVTVTWPLDGTPVEWEEGFKQKLSFTKVNDTRIDVHTVSVPEGAWTNDAIWTIEVEDGQKYQYRRSTFTSKGGKELKWVSKFKYVGQN